MKVTKFGKICGPYHFPFFELLGFLELNQEHSLKQRKRRLCCVFKDSHKNLINYSNMLAPTAKFTSLLIVRMLAINKKLPIQQTNVKSAFLFAPLKEDLYIKTPKGLKKNALIYFNQSEADPCIYIHKNKASIMLFHVDDLIVVGDHMIRTFLGMDVTCENKQIKLNQQKLIWKGLELAGIEECQPLETPLNLIQLESISGNSTLAANNPIHLTTLNPSDIILIQLGQMTWKHDYCKGALFFSRRLVRWIGIVKTEKSKNPTKCDINNQGLLEKLKNFGSNSKTKHLDIKMKTLCEMRKKK
ncbi:hypothetical protein VP01_192g5 [Puccinia sorghi]|uniref:Reverse transcriptase Ty1/copia-type domain-containing protein n=1 Tax=Puccinia sorghi TaxID=27349 RepID=A0A0L6VCK5_9BASI|nr:hypothetical protein VP01_192g5 [Puccinia sorghi]